MRPAIATMLILALLGAAPSHADDWPMLGRDNTRNAVSPEQGAPTDWDVGRYDHQTREYSGARGVRWTAKLGSACITQPVVSNGLVWIGSNNHNPDFPDATTDMATLLCFRERDGKLLYRYAAPRLPEGRTVDYPYSPIGSSPLIEDERLWFFTSRGEIVCWDIGPLLRGADAPRDVWKVDLRNQLGVHVHAGIMFFEQRCSIASYQDWIYVITNNGVDEGGITVPNPEAPTLVCFHKHTGDVVWTDNSPGKNILRSQPASPLVIDSPGREQIVVPMGDGWVRAFDPRGDGQGGSKLLWKFDMNHKDTKWSIGGRGTRNQILGTPVYYQGRVYLANGQQPEHGEGPGRLVCLDPTRTGDISSQLAVDARGCPLPDRRFQAVVPEQGERAIANPNSGLVWEYVSADHNGDGRVDFEEEFHRTVCKVAIKDDLLIATDMSGLVHCLDARTGKRHWAYDCFAGVRASPLIVNDKVYVADEDGDVAIFRLTPEAHDPLREINLENSIHSSPVFANGTLYVANQHTLFAIADEPSAATETPAAGGNWPQWRGPNRDNVSTETGLLQEWPEGGPPLLWRVEGIGEGIACVSIAEGRIYTTGYHEQGEFLTALDQHTGQRVWATRIGPRVEENRLMRWLSQRSPTVDGERLYAITTAGHLVCLTRDGRELWSKSYPDDFDALRPTWGFCDYPLVDGEKLICTPGGAHASVVALDKRTGEEIWRVAIPDGGRAAYAAVVAAEVGGVRQYIAFLQQALVGVRASDGELLWSNDKIGNTTANSHTPTVRGDRVLVTSGYGSGVALLKLIANGEKVEAQEQYFERVGLDAFQDNSVLVGDHLYAIMGAHLCLDWTSGQRAWHVRTTGRGKAAVTYADQRLYLHQSDGRVTLADVSPAGHQERGHFMLPDHAPSIGATSPVIAGGRLYLRGDHRLFCYDVREDALQQPSVAPPTIVFEAPGADTVGANRSRTLRSVFVPTPQDVVEKMLELADVKPTDVVYDLGSGDGRIVITAAKKHGCRAVGYEIDRELVETSRERAKQAGVERLVTFEQQDLFTADLRAADVIAVYLLPQQLEKLLPQFAKLRPGTRIVSHHFEISGVEPDRTVTIRSNTDGDLNRILLWTTPLKAAQQTPE